VIFAGVDSEDFTGYRGSGGAEKHTEAAVI